MEDPVEDFLTAGLAFFGGVVSLAAEGGCELDGGVVEGAGLADRFEVAVELDGPGAVAVAEHTVVHLGAEATHFVAFVVGGQVSFPPDRGGFSYAASAVSDCSFRCSVS